MARNVHKQNFNVIKLPIEAIQEDRGLRSCATPQLVLASRTDAAYYKNDRTALAFKFDSMSVELEDSEGNTISAPGVEVTFPYQSDAVGFVVDWRQVEQDGNLMQGCWRIVVNWELSGMSGSFYYGSYLLREYSVLTAKKTVRLFVVLNDIVKRQGINYKDSGFAGTVRFEGQFGYMQPNYETENIIYTNNTREKVRIEALRTYELRTNYLLHCMTRLVDEETLLAASQIYVTDHNANNHRQDFYDFPVILSEDESPTFEYNDSIYAKITAKFKDKVADHESKYDGNIQGSDNIILTLPAIVNQTEPCSPVDVYVGEANVGTFPSGSDVFVKVIQDGLEVIPEDVTVVDDEVSIILADVPPCPDTNIEVNGVSEGSVPSGSTIDVQLSDSGGTVTPDSVTLIGTDLQIVLPDAVAPTPVGATLMKTGQTTSYRTGDDGDIEAGRATNFTTLAVNNPFGNTNRFTDELGGQTYTNNIVIDWSTYQGNTVLGWYRTPNANSVVWNVAIDSALTISVGSFTSGWRLPNIMEFCSILNWGLTSYLNYSPFNLGGIAFQTSTTWGFTTTNNITIGSTGFPGISAKTNASGRYVGVRDFTVTGTTLT